MPKTNHDTRNSCYVNRGAKKQNGKSLQSRICIFSLVCLHSYYPPCQSQIHTGAGWLDDLSTCHVQIG